MNTVCRGLLTVCIALVSAPALAADDVFARQGDQQLSQGDMDAAFARIPEEDRLRFVRDGGRVNEIVTSLLRTRTIAADAEANGFAEEELVANRLRLGYERELARLWLERVVADAPEADYAALAREYYLGHPDEFMSPETLDVSHILIATDERSDEDALALIADIEARLAEDPSQFEALVDEFSDDPGKVNNRGRYPQMKRGDMVAAFEQAAFALEDAGQLSGPVQTGYGYHLIRLNGRTPAERIPYDEVKDALMEQEKRRYLAEYRERYIRQLLTDPIEIPDGAVETMARRYFGENLELR
ncbi:MAG: peptidylprolyl isomerase [Xanthomonadales bacterium]